MGIRKGVVYKGKWGESKLSMITIASLMGCSRSKTKQIIYGIRDSLGDVTDEMIGMAIQEVRNKRDLKVNVS